MNRWGYMGLVGQSLALFVGMSILLGRVYSVSHFNFLGIPLSELNLNVIDYSVVATRVTIMGIAVPVVIAIIYLFARIRRSKGWDKFNFFAGVVLIALSVLMVWLLPGEEDQQAFGTGREVLLLALMFGIAAAGGLLVGGSLPQNSGACSNNANENVESNFNFVFMLSILFFLHFSPVSLSFTPLDMRRVQGKLMRDTY